MENYFMPMVVAVMIGVSPIAVFMLDKLVKPTHSWVRLVTFFILCGACSAGLVTGLYVVHNALT